MIHRINLRTRHIHLFLILTAFLVSCKKNEDTPRQGKQWMMTIHFTNDFINPKLNAIVFVSDAKGVPVADTMVAGNPTLTMYSVTNITYPMQVTIAKWEPDMHNFLVTINTYVVVTPSEWTLRGDRLVSGGEATVNLVNVPAHTGPVLFSSAGYSDLTFATTGRTIPIYQSPDDLFLRINTSSGTSYKWKYGIAAGGTYDVDLSSTEAAQEHTVSLPFPAQDFNIRLSGYRDTSNVDDLPIVADEQIGAGTLAGSITVGYPAGAFQGFLTRIEMIDSWTSPFSYIYSTFGQVPDAFVKINASLVNVQIQGSKTKFTTDGQFTVTAARWHFQDADKLAFDWTVSGPDTLTTISLPALSPAMRSMFPTLSPDSLQLYQFELMQYPAITSWSDYLNKSFSPVAPGRFNRLGCSAVRMMVD